MGLGKIYHGLAFCYCLVYIIMDFDVIIHAESLRRIFRGSYLLEWVSACFVVVLGLRRDQFRGIIWKIFGQGQRVSSLVK